MQVLKKIFSIKTFEFCFISAIPWMSLTSLEPMLNIIEKWSLFSVFHESLLSTLKELNSFNTNT